ncbi:uncharacterized protein C8Q71DRAFT_275697 [Rhodofomes roseus]|uniref:Uncharacterized protein n=1 Tax=Rhodofomes roseus TaxID=34475 RepID=A0ABQ8K4Y2_9APHY|nr:uncharacterized protein C8Q71DRAFT_275697 [Rhodofomes roseus]KAH9831988.1 hypothetical protein C8Q71DRAFT_275697 [Rhodofomes roseus]
MRADPVCSRRPSASSRSLLYASPAAAPQPSHAVRGTTLNSLPVYGSTPTRARASASYPTPSPSLQARLRSSQNDYLAAAVRDLPSRFRRPGPRPHTTRVARRPRVPTPSPPLSSSQKAHPQCHFTAKASPSRPRTSRLPAPPPTPRAVHWQSCLQLEWTTVRIRIQVAARAHARLALVLSTGHRTPCRPGEGAQGRGGVHPGVQAQVGAQRRGRGGTCGTRPSPSSPPTHAPPQTPLRIPAQQHASRKRQIRVPGA